MLNPFVLWRLLRAVIITRVQKRNLLPKDIWKLKGIVTGGTDTAIFKDKIEHYWGIKPLEGYGCTEVGAIACQAWNFNGMTFTPDRNFLEFMPYEEHLKIKENPTYAAKTKLLNELEEGIYELVVTNFHGGVFTRYRVKDLFEVISIGDDEIGSVLPQFQLYSRNGDLIDLGGMVRLTERDIWKAIENSGISYQDFIARKEYVDQNVMLHLYIEPKPGKSVPIEDTRIKISNYLRENLQEYRDSEEILGIDPLVLSLLPLGAFQAYKTAQKQAGADLENLKPTHIQPDDRIVEQLLHPE
jgi:phenylacetate-coenzyme A ligase PaaK-like adenylate-forming protein